MKLDHVHLLTLFIICVLTILLYQPALLSIVCFMFMIRTIYILNISDVYWKNVLLILACWTLFWMFLFKQESEAFIN